MFAAKGPRFSSRVPKIRSALQGEFQSADAGLFSVGADSIHAQVEPRDSCGFKPTSHFQRDSEKSGSSNEQFSIGSVLEKIVSRARQSGSPLYTWAAEESKGLPVWKFVLEKKVSIEPKPDKSFCEWLTYAEMVSPTTKNKDSALVVNKIIQKLNSSHAAQFDWINIKLCSTDVITVLTKVRSLNSAFVFYMWIRERPYYASDKSIYNALIERLLTSIKLDTWEQMHVAMKDMIDSGTAMEKEQFEIMLEWIEAVKPIDTLRMHPYVECFLKMQPLGLKPSSSTYEKMMRICNKLGMYDSTIALFKSLSTKSDSWAFSLALSACKCSCNVALVEELIREMKSHIKLDAKRCNQFLTLYATLGHADKARDLLEEMKISGVSMDLRPYTSVIHAYGKARRVKEAEELFRSIEQRLDPVIYRAMAACYRNAGHFNELLALLREQDGLEIQATCFEAALEACIEKEEWKIALAITKDMQERGMSPARRLYSSILLACSKENDYSACKVLEFNVREIDALSLEEVERIIKMSVALEKVSYVLDALEVLNEQGLSPPTPDLFEYCILSFTKTNIADAMKMYEIMRCMGYIPSSSVLTTLIQEHVSTEAMVQGKGLHGEATKLENLLASLILPPCKI